MTNKSRTVARTREARSLNRVISWHRGIVTTESGDELPAWVLKHGKRVILCATSMTPIIEAVSKPDRKFIAEAIAASFQLTKKAEARCGATDFNTSPSVAVLALDVHAVVRPLVYLACPYSHPVRAVRVRRFEAVNRAAAKLMRQGLHIFSPISHTHPIAETGELPLGWEYWQAYGRAYLTHCHKLIILRLDGWDRSKGVEAELRIANELGLTVEFMDEIERIG